MKAHPRPTSVLLLTLGIVESAAIASTIHEILQTGVVCSSKNYNVKLGCQWFETSQAQVLAESARSCSCTLVISASRKPLSEKDTQRAARRV
jgi:hypothetical protein